LVIQLFYGRAQSLECLGIVKGALDKPDPLGQLLPGLLAERCARVLLHGIVDDLLKVFAIPFATSKTRERESWRQESAVGEVVYSGHQLLAGEIARHAKHYKSA